MSRLTICRGLPGCGKTRYAMSVIAGAPRGQVARVNRDDLRASVFGTGYQPNSGEFEDLVTGIQHEMIASLLDRGVDVICDDTNLYTGHVANLIRLANTCGHSWAVRDLTSIPLATCITWDGNRPPHQRVGPAKIHAMYLKHRTQGWAPMPVPDLGDNT